MRVVWSGLVIAAVVTGGCGSVDTAPPVDASVVADLGLDAPAVDALAPSDAAADAPTTCDPGAPPVAASALPAIRGAMVIVGDGGTVPTPGGGDPTGQWAMTSATLYWPAIARGQINTEGGAITGTGWVVIDGSNYRLSTDLVLRVDSTAAGLVVRPSTLASRGTYTASGGSLALSPVCFASTGMSPGGNSLGFSRDGADRGRLFVTLAGAAGMATLVFDLQRAP